MRVNTKLAAGLLQCIRKGSNLEPLRLELSALPVELRMLVWWTLRSSAHRQVNMATHLYLNSRVYRLHAHYVRSGQGWTRTNDPQGLTPDALPTELPGRVMTLY